MRVSKSNQRLHPNNRRIHGGAIDTKLIRKNIEKLTENFSKMLGNSKKNVKFALKF